MSIGNGYSMQTFGPSIPMPLTPVNMKEKPVQPIFSRKRGTAPDFQEKNRELYRLFRAQAGINNRELSPLFSMEPKQRHLGRWQKPSRIMPAVSIEK
jgi:hypothetical protein